MLCLCIIFFSSWKYINRSCWLSCSCQRAALFDESGAWCFPPPTCTSSVCKPERNGDNCFNPSRCVYSLYTTPVQSTWPYMAYRGVGNVWNRVARCGQYAKEKTKEKLGHLRAILANKRWQLFTSAIKEKGAQRRGMSRPQIRRVTVLLLLITKMCTERETRVRRWQMRNGSRFLACGRERESLHARTLIALGAGDERGSTAEEKIFAQRVFRILLSGVWFPVCTENKWQQLLDKGLRHFRGLGLLVGMVNLLEKHLLKSSPVSPNCSMIRNELLMTRMPTWFNPDVEEVGKLRSDWQHQNIFD